MMVVGRKEAILSLSFPADRHFRLLTCKLASSGTIMSSSSWFSSLRTFLTPPSRQSLKFSRQLLLGLVFGFALSLSSTSLALYVQSLRRKKAIEDAANAGGGVVKRPIEIRQDEIVKGVVGLIGEARLHE
jgi:hypothetical protein